MKTYFLKIPILLSIVVFFHSCKKENTTIDEETHNLPKPTAAFEYEIIDEKDPFTYQFTSFSKNSEVVRWSFGDDSTSSEINPKHTFLYTGDFNVKLIALNEEGYWAQKEETLRIKTDDLVTIIPEPLGNGELKLNFETEIEVDKVLWFDGHGSNAKLVSEENTTVFSFNPGQFREVSLRLYTKNGSEVNMEPLMSEMGMVRDLTNLDNNFTISHENSGGEDANEGSKKLIDNNITTKVFIGGVGGDLSWQFEFYQPQVINGYSMTSGNDAPERDPENWVVEGSNDGEEWEEIDQRNGERFDSRRLSRTFLFHNNKSYKFYRFKMTKLLSGSNFQMSEFRLLYVPQ